MLGNLRKLLLGDTVEFSHHDGLQVATAALLVSAAHEDGAFDAAERTTILDLLERQFGLSRDDAASLMRDAEREADRSVGLHRYVTLLNQNLTAEERVRVIEMLWEVVYADGRLDDYEANLMRRVGGLLGVSDFERGEARKRVLARRSKEG
jgi:uncharacterized tellurite resistance protein B-like protein